MKLFVDIETIKNETLSPELEELYKVKHLEKSGENGHGLFPEYGQIICISCGKEDAEGNIKTKSFAGVNERELIKEFFLTIRNHNITELVGHNLIGFDLPYITKRAIILDIPIPKAINIYGLKPWNIKHLDTMVIWKMTSYNNTSLDVLCDVLGVASPKDGEVKGSGLQEFWENDEISNMGKIQHIAEYCERDVVATYKCFKKIEKLLIVGDKSLDK